MQCPKCKNEIREGAVFCGKCGTELLVPCPACDFENPSYNNFCEKCGHNLAAATTSSPKDLTIDEKIERLQKYIPKGLTEKILSQRTKIEGERKQVTVMFADMEGFTPLVEKIGSEKTYTIMDEVYEILIHKVYDFEGTVNELTGDGIMALFGAPIAIENAPQKAIQSALAIHRELTRFNDQKRREGLPSPLKMRIGIHTGPVVVGTLGNDLRVEFKAVGDTVNLASRMEDLAEPGTTYVTEDTFKLTEGLFRFETLGEKQVKGKEDPIRIYRVIAPSTLSTRFEVSAERGLTHFVGRERELELLLDGFERVKAGRGQAFSIVSEAGVGKTRLLYEFRKAVANEELWFREGRCLSYSQNEAYHPITDILKANFDIHEGDEDYQINEKIKQVLRNINADVSSTLPYLLELFGVEDSGEDKSLSQEERKYQFIEAMKRVALKGSEVRPVIMAVEDLHWIDKGSEEALKSLFESIAAARIMLIFTYRPEYIHTWGTKTYHNQLMLNRLSNRESLSMVSHILGGVELESALEELILEKTEGVPFYIEEFLKSLTDLGVMELRDGRYDLSRDAKQLAIPSTIQDVIMSRIDALPDGAKDVLQTGSVIEREFNYELIKQVMNLPEKELLSYLSLLKDTELVYERGVYPETSYTFKHALTREVAYESILTEKKKKIHENIGQAIEAIYPESLEEFYGTLAYHYNESENLEKAYQYLILSSNRSMAIYAFREAARLMEKAIEVKMKLDPWDKEKHCDLLLMLGDILILTGEPRRVLDREAPEAWSLAEDIKDKKRMSRVCQLAMWALDYYGVAIALNTSEARMWVERADTYAEPETKERALADANLGFISIMQGNHREGIQYSQKAIKLAHKLSDPETRWVADISGMASMCSPHRIHQLTRLLDDLSKRSLSEISLMAQIFGLLYITLGYLFIGKREKAEKLFNETLKIHKRIQVPHLILQQIYKDALFAMLDGHIEESVNLGNKLAITGNELGLALFTEALGGTIFLRPRLYLGKADEAIPLFDQDLSRNPVMRILRSAHQYQDNEVAEMLEMFVLSRPDFGTADDEMPCWIDTIGLEAAVLTKHRAASDALLKRLSDNPFPTTGWLHSTCTARHLGAAAQLLERPDQALQYYMDAIKVAKEMNFRPELALTRFQLAELLLKAYPKKKTEAKDHLEFAINEFREMKMKPSLELALKIKNNLLS